MLFHVKMTVKLPVDMDPAKAAQLKADEKELAHRRALRQLQRVRRPQRRGPARYPDATAAVPLHGD